MNYLPLSIQAVKFPIKDSHPPIKGNRFCTTLFCPIQTQQRSESAAHFIGSQKCPHASTATWDLSNATFIVDRKVSLIISIPKGIKAEIERNRMEFDEEIIFPCKILHKRTS